jgi:hypothetical protein
LKSRGLGQHQAVGDEAVEHLDAQLLELEFLLLRRRVRAQLLHLGEHHRVGGQGALELALENDLIVDDGHDAIEHHTVSHRAGREDRHQDSGYEPGTKAREGQHGDGVPQGVTTG